MKFFVPSRFPLQFRRPARCKSHKTELAIEDNIVALGWVAFFAGVGQDMIQSVLPQFYASALGLNKEFIGLIEGGLATAASFVKIGAGYCTDALGAKKPLVFVGYGLSAIARLGLGFAGTGGAAFCMRLADGVGKGMKDAPRDALVAGSAGTRKLGLAFGVQRTLGTLGCVVGPLLSFGLLNAWSTHPGKYREIFLVGGAASTIALLIIGIAVRERRAPVAKFRFKAAPLHGPFVRFLGVLLIFTLGNSSDAFMLLRAQEKGVSATTIPLMYALFNLVSAATAVTSGKLSDRIGRRRVIALGWMVYALVYFGFAVANGVWLMWGLFAFYGLHYSLTEGAGKAMVAELVAEKDRGTAYGYYNAAIGVVSLPASLIAGFLWVRISPAAPFAFGAVMAVVAVITLFLAVPSSKRARANSAFGLTEDR